jgi:hypothetical protein
VQDDVSYLLGAKTIAAGQLRIPIDPALGQFFDLGQFFEYRDGYMYALVPGLYFIGHPFLLALGVLAGASWVVNPISSGITLVLLFLLGRALFGNTTGLLAVALGALSPFARFQSASLMTHPSFLLFATAALLCLVDWIRNGRRLSALGLGACLGALLTIRPYDAAVFGAFVLLVIACSLRQLGTSRLVSGFCFAALGVAPFLAIFFGSEMALTFDEATGTYIARPHPAFWTLFHWIPDNFDHNRYRLKELNEDLFGWTYVPGVPSHLSLGLLLIALLVMPKTPADWLVAGWALLYVAAYASYPWHGNMFGPRYYYGSLGGQMLLVARLLHRLPELVARLGAWVWPPGRSARWRWLPWAAGAVPLAILVGPMFWGTLTVAYPNFYKSEYSNAYNGFSTAPLRLLREYGVTHGLIFMDELPRWSDVLTGIAANDANLNGSLIFARYIDGKAQLLMNARPSHTPYVMTSDGSALELGRLAIDGATGQIRYTPMPKGEGAPWYTVGSTNAFTPMSLNGGLALQGGIDLDGAGNIYLVNSLGHEILVFDAGGVLRRRVSVSFTFGPAAIRNGHGLAVGREGYMYVVDVQPPGLVRLNADGTFAWRLGQAPGAESDPQAQRFGFPFDVAVLPSGDLVVTDADSKRLHVVRPDGTFAGDFGGDSHPYRLERPFGVAVGPDGHLFISDFGLKSILELDAAGAEVRRWPLPLERVEPFEVPYVAVDARGHAYISAYQDWAIYHADPARAEVEKLDVAVNFPSGIAVRDRELLVVEAGGRKVQRVPLP